MYQINETHDPNLKSWVESANDPATDFPIQNLPFSVFGVQKRTRINNSQYGSEYGLGILIGDSVLDLTECRKRGLFEEFDHQAIGIAHPGANVANLMLAPNRGDLLRRWASRVLTATVSEETRGVVSKCLIPIAECHFDLPQFIPNYTDFYCSIYHATNVGSMFRPENPLMPNYKYLPIGYHGRASSIVVSGTDVRRPWGQNRSDAEKPPVFIPCKNLDYEMELGFFVGRGNELGAQIPISEAEEHIFGVCLVNDWSARDIQAWEYQPLGPFLAKNFATTISPFVVTMEALAPFRTRAFERDPDDPQPLDYLSDDNNRRFGGLDINLEVYIQTEQMRQQKIEPHLLSHSNTKDLYWTIGQMLTHHASGGCNLQTGDLMATGTVSGKDKSERGCLLELTWRGSEPLTLPSGETRRFLEDGDEIIMKGYCEREGFRRIGLGECRGRVLPALER